MRHFMVLSTEKNLEVIRSREIGAAIPPVFYGKVYGTLMVKILPIHFLWDMKGGGGATFLISDGFQNCFGAIYHEMVLSSPEHKVSGNFEFLSCELVCTIIPFAAFAGMKSI